MMDILEIQETLKDANEYLIRLEKLNVELGYAEEQIKITAKETEDSIKIVFDALLSSVRLALFARRDELILKTTKIKEWGLSPLTECRRVVEKKIQNTSNLITLGHDLLKLDAKDNRLNEFTSKSSRLGSLPEVPQLKEVPHLSFQYDLSCEKDLVDICKDIGSVIHIAPVQIYALKEKPGAMLVKWNTSENDDRIADIQEYELQKAFGNLITEKHLQDNFRSCYVGAETQYLVKDLLLNQEYTFRVRCKFEGEAEWSPWSLSEVGVTTLKPFCWSTNEHFILTNEYKIATPLNNSSSLLFSSKSEFNVGYSVEFTFLECDNDLSETYVGLFVSDKMQDLKMIGDESIYVEANGSIYGSGSKKSTQFPSVTKGSKICFTCEIKDQNKMRLNIDSCGRRVTYDWLVNDKPIYFGARLNSSKWKIMID